MNDYMCTRTHTYISLHLHWFKRKDSSIINKHAFDHLQVLALDVLKRPAWQ